MAIKDTQTMIIVEKSTNDKLKLLKLEQKFKNVDEVIQMLIEKENSK